MITTHIQDSNNFELLGENIYFQMILSIGGVACSKLLFTALILVHFESKLNSEELFWSKFFLAPNRKLLSSWLAAEVGKRVLTAFKLDFSHSIQ